MSQHSDRVVIHGREAGDSFDFHARYGRALHAQAARECVQMLLARLHSLRRRRTRHPPWQVVWPEAEPSHGGCRVRP